MMAPARPAPPPPQALPAGTLPFRSAARDGTSQRDAGRDAAPLRQPAWLVDLTNEVTRSVFAIERIVERVATMREDNSHLRSMTADLRDALRTERSENGRRLVAQDRSMSREKRRAAAAEQNADALAGMLCDLERQLSSLRAHDEGSAAGTRAAAGAGWTRRAGPLTAPRALDGAF